MRLLPWFQDSMHIHCNGIHMNGYDAMDIFEKLRLKVEQGEQEDPVTLTGLEVMALMRILAGAIQS